MVTRVQNEIWEPGVPAKFYRDHLAYHSEQQAINPVHANPA